MGEKLDGLVDAFCSGGGKVDAVAAVVLARGAEVPPVDSMW